MKIPMRRIALSLGLVLSLIWVTPVAAIAPCSESGVGGVLVYEDAGYRGQVELLCSSDSSFVGNTFNNGLSLNDNISSWKFTAGNGNSRFTFYQNTGYDHDFIGYWWGSATASAQANTLTIYHNDTFSGIKFNY
jgi:hypothetical protein